MRKLIVISAIALIAGIITLSFRPAPVKTNKYATLPKDSVGSAKAFMAVYRVLKSSRCMNCHPSGDAPLQGDDSHIHTMNVKRGIDGKGLYSVRCSNCHQAENVAGLHMPPGNPKWGLPPADMRMVFQGRTPRQLALQLLDPKQNGGRTKAQLIDHMANDDLVGWAWHPGDGRTLPPMTRQAFAAQVRLWIAKGAYAPSAKAK
ncbi:hypothetical protein [Mucilaginibacter sp.]|uniref:hypothetical protein n=1 Tax=Mucilaginibacter sp. TaxID=1882438 RepID=UPI00260CDB16|nr:hypothetical protein [Mucilaginibacter sp.]MDB4920241.1 hypothetical protein [Mucilaginibacter sp.]